MIIAVDGPAGSGKSSVCKGVARRLGARYLDTGAMYRAMTEAILTAGIDPFDADAVAAYSTTPAIVSGTDPLAPTISVDGRDVSVAIRQGAVTSAVSPVSAVPAVRERLVALQRSAVVEAVEAGAPIVVEGRDITTVVLPEADVRIFLTADPEIRALRRARENGGDDAETLMATEAALRARDAYDSSRMTSPLRKSETATELDTTHLTLDEVIDLVVELAGQA